MTIGDCSERAGNELMKIRVMNISDYESVYRVWMNTAGVGMRSIDDSRAGIEKFLKRNPTTNFVAEIDGKIIGVTLSGHDGRRGYIYHTAVTPECRGSGIGKALVQAVCEAMAEEGINKVALVVFKANDLGNAFWKSQGWEQRLDLNYYNLSLNEKNT